MDVNKLVQYRMVNGELNPHSPSSDYSVKYVDKHNYLTYLSDIKNVSDIIIKQIPDWKEAPTVEVVIERFVSNSYTYLFYYKNTCIGWNWGNPNFTYNWIDIDYQLKSNETYLGGCFVSLNKEDRPNNAGYSMCYLFFKESLSRGFDAMYGVTDDWNRRASVLYYRLGWKTYNFIKD
jgi:hypothetical protein